MYNRYVPQGDGTFQRNQMPDAPPRQAPATRQNPARRRQEPQQAPTPPPEPRNSPSYYDPPSESRESSRHEPYGRDFSPPQQNHEGANPPPFQGANWDSFGPPPKNQNASTFFSRFLPKNMDSGDLLMLLILLLLLSDGDDDAPPVLLTIALYFLLKND